MSTQFLPERSPSLETMKSLLLEWQERLGLQDWNLLFFWRKAKDQESEGRCKYNPRVRQGVIHILDPNQSSDYESCVRYPEAILVHELLHVRFDIFPIPDEDKEEHAYNEAEAAIELTALALVAAKYGYTKLPVIQLNITLTPQEII